MAERIFAMPDLGEGLEEGEIVAWLVAEGDTVELNQPLVEIETAKATVEVPSPFSGVIERLHGAAGVVVAVGAPLVTFQVAGASEPDGVATPRTAAASPDQPFVERRAGGAGGAGATGAATPPVRRLAKDLGVDIGTVEGSGPGGRVLETDVRRLAGRAAEGPQDAQAVTLGEDLGLERVEIDPVRRAIAATLTAQAAIPQVTTFRTTDCTELQRYRKELGVSPLPVVVAALCRIVEGHPLLNARWAGDHIELRGKVNVGIAVDTDRGLVVPVLQDAARRTVTDLAAQITRLATGARAGKLTLDDIAPTPTIAVSNTGSYGSEAGTPILSPGTSVTLGLGVIAPRALVVDGEVQARPASTLSLTFDHRVVDGAGAGAALTDLVALLQSGEGLRDLAG